MSTPLRLLRALLGLAVLAALVAGIPLVLLVVGHQPTDLAGGWDLLTQQDDGQFFFTVLTTIGWIGWALFTFSALVEIVAMLRGRKARRIKGLGGMQGFAGLLIGGLVLLAPTAASAATTSPAVAATAVQTAGTSSTAAAPAVAPASEQDTWPTHTVTGDSELPWDLAEQYLGSGPRWKDIAALNPSIPQLAAGDQFLPKGAVIRLPADANIAKPAAPAPAPAQATPETAPPAQQAEKPGPAAAQPAPAQAEHVTVRPGESLWTIAGDHGDPEDWPRLYEANKGNPLPGGGTFDNPDLIVPGQELTLPTATAPTPPGNTRPAPDTTPEKPDTANEAPTPAPAAPAPSSPATPAPAASTPSTTPAAPAPAPAPSPVQGGQLADTAQQLQDADEALAPAAVWMGAGALAAALIGTLATRRVLQQRRRRPGRRIPMPTGSAAATEQGLRSVQHPTGFDLLDATLRTLALNLADADRDLPVVTAVVLHEHKVELHLDQDTVPMKPFSGTAGRTDLWTCAASSPDLADPDTLQGADAPYPALVSLGWDGSSRLVLVDLEYVGVLHLDGDPDHARHVLQAIAVELASTPLAGHLEITALSDTAPGLDEAAPERVARTQTLTDALAELTSHAADQRRALTALGAPSLRAARLHEDAGGSWTPHILLAADLPEVTETEELFDLMTVEPRVAGAVVTSSGSAVVAPADGWTLHCMGPDDSIVLPASGLPIKLQGLSDAHFADAIELLTLSASTTDVPARDEWLEDLLDPAETPEADDQQEPAPEDSSDDLEENSADETPIPDPVAGADEDGMPDEYADIEQEELETPAAENAAPADETGQAPAQSEDSAESPADPAEGGPTGPTLADLFNSSATPEPPAPAPVLTKEEPTPVEPEPAAVSPLPVKVPSQAPSADDAEAPYDTAPTVLLLGRVVIEGAAGRIDSNRQSAAVELVSYLALNPGVDHHAIDDALWPGRLVNKEMRNSVISRTRSWLGKDSNGDAYFPRVHDTGDSRYRLAPAVTCDWRTFQHHARTGLARHDEDGELALRRALALVRGRPFAAIDPQRYAWAEPAVQEMVSAIADVAYELSTRRREAADYAGALWAAHQGLLAAEENELLHRQAFLAHHAAGDLDALRQAAARLARINESLGGGVDMEAETAQLLSTLLPKPVILR
ncbi:LysM peptidoglycan-binding domain-containing protein [Streptomyces antarcticus]|uniref:LysM peptidoglycan-binding domain-containing protein n=1 Tax=Streptomyces antarcticus TaxID=2996458 RepID=UPI00226FEA75|nr:LysM peptidoglycan-binding domain-containing protein [Streptomyces sp. H34-AA3]MCY0945646.1 LysM peptidoglycan-binding domain-containing protein [Streptomyces sp. H34-AA3]